MKIKHLLLVSFVILIIGLTAVSAADSDDTATTDNSGSDVAVDSSSSTTQATDTSTHTDSSVDKTSDTSSSSSSSQKTDVTSQSTTQKVTEKTSEKTQTTSDTTAKDSFDTNSQSTQSTSQSTSQSQSNSNITNENTNSVNEKTVDTNKVISMDDDVSSEADVTVWNVTDLASLDSSYLSASPGDILNFEGNFSSFSRIFGKNLTLTSYSSANFTNVELSFGRSSNGSTISNLYIDNSESGKEAINVFSASDLTIINNTIVINSTSHTGKGITLNGTDNIYIDNNNIIIHSVSDEIDWSVGEGVPTNYGIGIFNSSNIWVRNNNIECISTESNGYASTFIGVSIQGSVQNSKKTDYIHVLYNNITVKDERYAYGLYLQYNVDSCEIDYNNITSINKNGLYAAGINEFSTDNLSMVGNNITLDVDDTAYGIVLTGDSEAYSSNKSIMSNNINVTSNRTRGIELYYVNDSLVQSNSIIVNGNYTEGICGGSTQYTNITKNRIMVNGVYINSTKDIDEIPLINTGIYLTQSAYENKTNIHSSYYNNITGNYIYSYGNSTIFLSASYDTVTNNQLTLNRGNSITYGDETVYNNGTENNISDNTGYILSDSNLDSQILAVNHVITQDNYQDYFIQKTDTSDGGLSDSVNDGDVLDFQGTLNLTNNQSLIINKAVNVTSSTGDALICLNTEAGTLLGEDQGSCFVVNNGGAYSNITNINFFNTQIWITNTSYVVFDNISAIVNGSRVGSGVGQTSIRPGCEYITIKNSYFYTADNGGSSSVVIAGGKYCTIDNNTVEGEGQSGNLIYLTTYNADLDDIDDFNSYNNITNNHVICNGSALGIRWGIVLTGHDNNVINNTIDYPEGGIGITQQWGYSGTTNTTIINNTCVNCGQSNIPENSTVYGNTFSGVQISAGSTFYNNTVGKIQFTGDNCFIVNNTIISNETTVLNTSSSLIENNTFSGENQEVNLVGSNNAFNNNIINGSTASLTINGSNNIIENNTIYKITDSPYVFSELGVISVEDNSNNNTVRYNDLINYDLFRGKYTVGDDCVIVADDTTGNIVQDNYGNVSELVLPTPEEGTNYTYITYNVTSMEELISALDDIKANGTYSNDTKYVINLLEGDYTVTEAITWGGATSDVREVIINGTGQIINGNYFNSTFLTIASGYSLTLNNVTLSNFTLDKSKRIIVNSGNLTIYNSELINVGLLYNSIPAILIINNTKITETAISGMEAIMNITNSTFYDTNLLSESTALITNTVGNLTFMNNNVTNITATYVIYAQDPGFMDAQATDIIESNIFTDINSTRNDISLTFGAAMDVNDKLNAGTFIYNTFINGANLDIEVDDDFWYFYDMYNDYVNCSIPVTISNIRDSSVTTEDYTTTVTITTNSSYGTTVDGQIIVSIDGKEYKTFDVVNGKANITIENSALNLLDNQIEIRFVSENGGFANNSTTFTLTLNEEMVIKIPEGTLYSGDQITLTTQVAVNGSIAKDGYVIFKVNGKTVRDENGNPIMIEVDENGMASLNYTIPDTNSNEYNITAVYSGSEGIVRTNTTLTTTLKTATITVEPITAKAGQTVTLRAYITDQNGNAVTTGKLIFKLNGKTLKDSEGNTLYATIVNGVATLNYTIPDNFSAKDYILTAVYQGTGFERSEANSTLTLTKSTPTIIPDSSVFGSNNTITINQGTESVNIKATINDPETNAPIDTTTVVTIKINDKTVTQQYVSNGVIDMTIYTSSFNNPEYNITVVVGENSQYARTSFNGTLIVNPMNSLANETSYNGTLLVKED